MVFETLFEPLMISSFVFYLNVAEIKCDSEKKRSATCFQIQL